MIFAPTPEQFLKSSLGFTNRALKAQKHENSNCRSLLVTQDGRPQILKIEEFHAVRRSARNQDLETDATLTNPDTTKGAQEYMPMANSDRRDQKFSSKVPSSQDV